MSAQVRLSFPCFFRIDTVEGKRRHTGWPVLWPRMVVTAASPREVSHTLAERVREGVREGETSFARRLAAAPSDTEIRVEPFDVPWRGRRVTVPLRCVRFARGGHIFTAVPRVGAILAFPETVPPAERGVATQAALDRWFRTERREVDAEDEPWSDRAGDRVLWLDASVTVPWEGLEGDQGTALFRALFGQEKVRGSAEIGKVARRLDQLYPDRLGLDLVPDPRVDALRRLIFVDPRPVPTVIVGPSGSGKTTLVHAAVRRQLDETYARSPKEVQRLPRLHHLDPNRVIAGMSRVGAWERRMVAILDHLVDGSHGRRRDGLFVDQPLALARVGRSAGSALTLTSVLRPWVEARRLPILLEATPEAWVRMEELDRAFTDLFHVERVDTPSRDVALAQLLTQVEEAEQANGAVVRIDGLRRVVELHERFPARRGLPGGLVDRLSAVAGRAATVDAAAVDAAFQGFTALRPEIVDARKPLPDAPLRARIAARLIGQPAAVDALAELVHVLHAGLARPGRPLASWLLVGPTGVGKTEAAKVLTGLLFTSPDGLVRVDMNEYADAGAVGRLLGEGGTDGHLPSRLRGRTVAVLLLDEVEKAHPSVHDLLLQVLDEGRLTDGNGQTLDLSRTAILLTSNVGAGEVSRGAGFDRADPARGGREAGYRAAVERAFRPELVNRLDRVLVFGPLSLDDVRKVAALQIQRILAREGLLRRTVLLDVHPDALDGLARAGFDPELGARALKRLLEARLVAGVAERLAAVPFSTPLVLEVRAEGTDVRLDVRLLRFAPRLAVLAEPPPLDAGNVRALLDTLPPSRFLATISAAGVRVEGGHVSALAERLAQLLVTLEVDDEPPDVEEGHLVRVHRRATRARAEKGWRVAEPTDWMGALSYRSVREFLLEAPTTPREREDVDDERWALVRTQVRALAGESAPIRVSFTAVTSDGPVWELAAPYLDALADTLARCSIDVTRWRRTPVGWQDLRAPKARELWQVQGPGAEELFSFEQGIHVFYPEEGSPVGLRVWVTDGGEPADLAPPAGDTIVRISPGPWTEDLATGARQDVASLLPTVWARRGGG